MPAATAHADAPTTTTTGADDTILSTLRTGEFPVATPSAGSAAAQPPPTEYRAKQFTAIPDVGASVRKWAAATQQQQQPADLVPRFLEHVLAPRVSVFALLTRALGQAFSLDNGLVLQTLVCHWLQRCRAPKRDRGSEADELLALKRHRQAFAVWWEARVVRVWTWPAEDEPALARLCRRVLAAALSSSSSTSSSGPSTELCLAAREHTLGGAGQGICEVCTRGMLEDLRVDYQHVTLAAAAAAHCC